MEGIVWLALCVGVGYLANKKGRSGVGWGIASLIFSPLICGVIVALLKDNKQAESVTKVEMQQQSLQDRVAADEIKNNQQFQKIEKTINSLQSGENKPLLSGAGAASGVLDVGMKKCPYCGESIKDNAVKCRYCGAEIQQVAMKECPYCKEMIRADAVKCKYCRSDLSTNGISAAEDKVDDVIVQEQQEEQTSVNRPVADDSIGDMKLVKCPNCQSKVSLNAKYCDNCGYKL